MSCATAANLSRLATQYSTRCSGAVSESVWSGNSSEKGKSSHTYIITGELIVQVFSGAGKTQLALQLSLLVQLPVDQGGLNGSACYLTTSTSLPTPRLIQLLHEHPLLAGSRCTLDNIQTSATKSVSSLLHALSEIIPASINAAKDRPA